MKLFATLGPGDIVGARRRGETGQRLESETSIPFSEQLVHLCRSRGIELMGVSHHTRPDQQEDGRIRMLQGPRPLDGGGGWKYHLGSIAYAVQLAWRARRFGADLALVDSGTTHYFALFAFRALGIPVAINFHNVLWVEGFQPQRGVWPHIRRLDAWFFRRHVVAAAGCSPECERQVRQIGRPDLPFFEWRGQFEREGFPRAAADWSQRPFRVVFSGRVEVSKGALDIPVFAAELERSHPGLFRWDVCGDGTAMDLLRGVVAGQDLGRVITLHGRLNRPRLLRIYAESHAFIVPTRGDFGEGMPLSCAEAVICQRPLVTSRVSNALPVLGPAIAEAVPEDRGSFVRALEQLALSREAYEAKRDACVALAGQFFDPAKGYEAAIDRLIDSWLSAQSGVPQSAKVL